jgi:hypothetical protein
MTAGVTGTAAATGVLRFGVAEATAGPSAPRLKSAGGTFDPDERTHGAGRHGQRRHRQHVMPVDPSTSTNDQWSRTAI